MRQNAGAESAFLTRFVCNALRAFYQMPFSGGLYPPLKQKSVYPPPIEAGVLGHLINKNEKTTIVEMASVVGITKRNIEKNIKILKDEGILLREGGKKEGYWKVVGNEYLS